ncbi:MAG: hypothetical protein KDE26_32285, partial [Bacteroidetes bacterium]|nr:hypothetical protein [Bacteroidota bacterium]
MSIALTIAMPLIAQFEASYERLYKEGFEAISRKAYPEAVFHFQAASRANPEQSQEADSMVLVVMR